MATDRSTCKWLTAYRFQLSRSISFGDMRGGPKIKSGRLGAPDFPRRPLADNFLYRALACVNAYKCAKFQLPSSRRGGLVVGRWTCDLAVAGSRPGRAAAA